MPLEKVTPHTHNDQDSPKLYLGDSVVSAPQSALTTGTTSTAGATYTATEQAMINNLKTRVAELETKLQTLGLIR